jgi:hypothetical protein
MENNLETKIDEKQTKWRKIINFLDGTQMFFLMISIPFIIIAPYCLKNVYEIVEETKKNRPDYVGPKWADFLWLFITLPLIALGKYLTYRTFIGFYQKKLPQKYQGKIRQHKIEKACDNIFKASYFTAISLYGYFAVVNQLPFDTPVIGNGSWHNYFIDFPYVTFLPATTYYCLLNLSYHTESAIHMVIHPGNDFFEMFCHHTMTFLIISIAYITNYNNIAIPFMLVIDNADIFVGMVRAGIDVLPEKLSFSIYIVLMFSWAYTRLYVFTFEILGVACLHTFKYASGRLTPHYFMTCMLSVLAILNFYWFFLLGRMGYRFATGRQGAVDYQKKDTSYVGEHNKEERSAAVNIKKNK